MRSSEAYIKSLHDDVPMVVHIYRRDDGEMYVYLPAQEDLYAVCEIEGKLTVMSPAAEFEKTKEFALEGEMKITPKFWMMICASLDFPLKGIDLLKMQV